MVRMEWSVDEFFSNGGTTAFIDRVSGSLGIHASEIKVVSVYEGSLVINYDVVMEDDGYSNSSSTSTSTTTNAEKLAAIKSKQIEAYSTGSMDLGAPISDVSLKVVEAEPATSSTSDNSSDSTSTSSDDSSEETIIQGGQITAPGYPPIVLNTETYFDVRLLRSKDTDYDAKALRLAQTLANVTKACLAHPCAILKTGTTTYLDPFFHVFGNDGAGWSFWTLENVGTGASDPQGIYLKEVVSVDDTTDANYGPGAPLNEINKNMLVADAQNGKVWHTGGVDRPILMAYDAVDPSDGLVHIHINKYDNLDQMRAAVSSETVIMPINGPSLYESKPSFESVEWHQSIANSKITLYFETNPSGNAVKLGKGIHGIDGQWTTEETIVDLLYTTDGFTASFSPLHPFIYQDETFYLTGSERMQNNVQFDENVLLLDADMTPLSVLPMQLPSPMDNILGNHTVATLKRMSDTVAISFQHRDDSTGVNEYTQSFYFVDLQQWLPKA